MAITSEVIEGVLRLVETRSYRNGKIVKRVLNHTTLIPEDIIVVRESVIGRATQALREFNAKPRPAL